MFQINNLTFGYDENNILIQDFSLDINKNDKICIIGRNGKGKTTLMRLLNGELKATAGAVETNEKNEIGYFGQTNINRLNFENTIEEELWEIDKTMPRSQVLAVAGQMMFSGDDTQKKIKVLSGGERARVLLGKIILKQHNILLLDEPTNHLDMESCVSLIKAIDYFKGVVITITHNEDFLNNIAEKLIVFDNNRVFVYDGIYSDFLKNVGWSEDTETKQQNQTKTLVKENKKDDKQNSKINRQKINKLENEIIELEIKLEEEVNKGNYNVSEIQKKIDDKMEELKVLKMTN